MKSDLFVVPIHKLKFFRGVVGTTCHLETVNLHENHKLVMERLSIAANKNSLSREKKESFGIGVVKDAPNQPRQRCEILITFRAKLC